VDAYRDNPSLGATEAARALGVHRNTIYGYTAELEAAGRIRRNGNQVEVAEG
jgi:DNA-binding IclR family transcriptional regulator